MVVRHRIQESLGPFATGNPRWYPCISEHLLRQGMEHDFGGAKGVSWPTGFAKCVDRLLMEGDYAQNRVNV